MAFVCNYLPSVIIFNIFRYLSPTDRLRASATCRIWRECLFQCSQWPHKTLRIDLSDSKPKTIGFGLKRNKQNRHQKHDSNVNNDSTLALNCFLHKCSRFLNHLVITFDPNSAKSLNHLIQIIDILLSDEEYNNNDNNINNNNNNLNLNSCLGNSRSLRRLTLNPINVSKTVDNINNLENTKIYELLQRLEQLIQRCDTLSHISFGCLQPLLNHSNRLLQSLAKRHSMSLKCLHLSSVKTDPDYYPVFDLSVQLLEPFESLRLLSIDFDSVNDQMLALMARKATIDTFVINVHGIDDEHRGLSKSSWALLAKSNPNLKVTVNLIHTDDSIDVLRDSLFDTDMPLAHLRAYFVGMSHFMPNDDSICYLINLVANRHSKTLLSLTLVNALKPVTLEPNPVFAQHSQNPLVMLAWRCRRLSSLTVIGYEVCDADLIAITRLRGASLKQLSFPMCCISLLHSPIAEDEGYYDDYYEHRMTYFLDGVPNHIQTKVIEDIAESLSRKWTPIAFDDLPNAVINGTEDMQTCYLSTILKDETICGESDHSDHTIQTDSNSNTD